MFGLFKKSVPTAVNNFSSLIGNGVIVGEISANGSIRIDGVSGSVIRHGGKEVTVVVSKTGIVTGDIVADIVIIEGRVDGNIKAKQVCFHSTANLSAGKSIEYDTLQVNPGAWIDGLVLTKMRSESAIAYTMVATVDDIEGLVDLAYEDKNPIPKGPENIILKEHEELPAKQT